MLLNTLSHGSHDYQDINHATTKAAIPLIRSLFEGVSSAMRITRVNTNASTEVFENTNETAQTLEVDSDLDWFFESDNGQVEGNAISFDCVTVGYTSPTQEMRNEGIAMALQHTLPWEYCMFYDTSQDASMSVSMRLAYATMKHYRHYALQCKSIFDISPSVSDSAHTNPNRNPNLSIQESVISSNLFLKQHVRVIGICQASLQRDTSQFYPDTVCLCYSAQSAGRDVYDNVQSYHHYQSNKSLLQSTIHNKISTSDISRDSENNNNNINNVKCYFPADLEMDGCKCMTVVRRIAIVNNVIAIDPACHQGLSEQALAMKTVIVRGKCKCMYPS
jgi:hypothetical protein